MFDTVRFICPKCESFIEVQSKAGACHMRVYNAPQDQIPDEIVQSLTGDLPYYQCGTCGGKFTPFKQSIVRVVTTLVLGEVPEEALVLYQRRGSTFTYSAADGKSVYINPEWYDHIEDVPLDVLQSTDGYSAEVVARALDLHEAVEIRDKLLKQGE